MKVYCDSSTREACYVIEEQDPVIVSYSEQVTVNVGEYMAVILALEEAKRLGLEQVEVLTDSQLVFMQVVGHWQCRCKHLLLFRDRVRELLLSPFILRWVPREENIAGWVLE